MVALRVIIISTLLFLPFMGHNVQAYALEAKALVERSDPYAGEPFIFQIQISGSENPDQPDLSHLTDFSVEYQGGQQNSSRSVTIINGKVTQDVREGYFFSYRLTPKREGRLVIPSIKVIADGVSAETSPVIINVQKPVETDDFKLRLELSKDRCYVGEPLILTVTWYIGKDVQDFSFTLPLLDDDTFYFADPEVDTQSGKQLYRIPLGNDEVIGEKGRGFLDNREYATITFKKALIPKRSGRITIEPGTVVCNALTGYESRRNMFGDDLFSNFFNDDFFGSSRRGVYKKVVVPSNSLTLDIADLPKEGQPANFSGHVGEYRITASAAPTEVNVGDPITLTISLSGPEYLEHINLPGLNQQPQLVKDFKVPKERATGEISGNTKVFTQTIRALRSDVNSIPQIELPYFDTSSRSYRVARTEPIPVKVKETKVITAFDAEGAADPVSNSAEIETWSEGIAFNYEDASVIENQRLEPFSWLKTPLWSGLIFIPPFIYIILLTGINIVRTRNADPKKIKARKAYGNLIKSLKNARGSSSAPDACGIIQDSFRDYLGDKLGIPKAGLTFNDVKKDLSSRGVDHGSLDRLKNLFHECEAGRFAGNAGISDTFSIVEKGIRLARDLEKRLK